MISGGQSLQEERIEKSASSALVHVPLPGATRLQIFHYLGWIVVLMAFGSPHGGVIDVPLSFVLKNKLCSRVSNTTAILFARHTACD